MTRRPVTMAKAKSAPLPPLTIEIDRRVFNKSFRPLLDCESRYMVLYGGAGSGKSVFIAQRYLYKMCNKKRCNLLVVRKTAKSNRDSTFALFKQIIHRWDAGRGEFSGLWKINDGDMRIRNVRNGNTIIFAGLDDVEKLKSITGDVGELTDIWIEEASEVLQSDFNQLDVRLRGGHYKKQITISFNPVSILHWLHEFVYSGRKNLTVHHSTYKDNRFLDDEYRELLESYKASDPYYYTVYCLGEWGVLGSTIFDAQKISERMSALRGRPQPMRGHFSFEWEQVQVERDGVKVTEDGRRIKKDSIKWVDDKDGFITVFSPPRDGYPYVIGGDTAGEGSDFFTGPVLDNTTGEQVAMYRHCTDEDLFAEQMYCLGMWYNQALMGPEANFSTYPIKKLQEMGYPHLFMREREDEITHKIQPVYGFRTDRLTRPLVIAGLVEVVRENVALVNDETTLGEMLTFVRNEKGRPEAAEGAHDDCIMGLAIAHYIRPQQRYTVVTEPVAPQVKLIDKLKPKERLVM
jgi:phage terminase large subunit